MSRYFTRRHKTRGRRSKLTRSRRMKGGSKKVLIKNGSSLTNYQEQGEVPDIYFSTNDEQSLESPENHETI